MAEKLGLVQFKKKVKYVRWDTINKFIKDIFPTSWENNVIIDCGNKGTTTIPFPIKKGVHYMRDMETGIIWFNAAEMARKLGIVDKKTGKRAGTEFIKWDRFNKYAKSVTINQNDFVDTCVDNLIINCGTRGSVTISYPIKNGDYVPYRLVLLIAMKVNNDVAREFQYELTNIVDEIINSGIKTNS